MEKGILYIMTTAVSGLIKIGITTTKNYNERMRKLESDGYYNVTGLKRFFAIEVDNYKEKENLLKDLFRTKRIAESELYTLDIDLAKQLLLAFDGTVIFPDIIDADKSKQFKKIAKERKQGALFNFYQKGIPHGAIINFIGNKSITAKVVGEREVEYQGNIYKLSPLALKLYEQQGNVHPSKSYRGAAHFLYKNKKLEDYSDVDLISKQQKFELFECD